MPGPDVCSWCTGNASTARAVAYIARLSGASAGSTYGSWAMAWVNNASSCSFWRNHVDLASAREMRSVPLRQLTTETRQLANSASGAVRNGAQWCAVVRSQRCGLCGADCVVLSVQCGVCSAESAVRSVQCGVCSAECAVRSGAEWSEGLSPLCWLWVAPFAVTSGGFSRRVFRRWPHPQQHQHHC